VLTAVLAITAALAVLSNVLLVFAMVRVAGHADDLQEAAVANLTEKNGHVRVIREAPDPDDWNVPEWADG